MSGRVLQTDWRCIGAIRNTDFAEGASSRTRRDLTIDLAREQMRRIGAAIPFVPLPATCRLLRQEEKMFDKDLKSRLPELSGEALVRG